MSVCEAEVVDAIGIENDSGKVVLTVSDHLEWDDDHIVLLEQKLNAYIAFIESGELLAAYPDAVDRQPVIDVVCKYAPSKRAEDFFSYVRSILEGVGIGVRYRLLGP
jgi:hypothetical protein